VTAVPAAWEVHAHNDYGLATANTLAAVQAGMGWVSTTVLGLGERAGNAALEEVAMGVLHLLGRPTGLDTSAFRSLACLVAEAAHRSLPPGKAVVGRWAFTHESGIHADGVLKRPSLYEPYDPRDVGGRSQLVVGKHSGRAALRHILSLNGIAADEAILQRLIRDLRDGAPDRKRPLRGLELRSLYESAH
jgi:homocitrate synthase NifV